MIIPVSGEDDFSSQWIRERKEFQGVNSKPKAILQYSSENRNLNAIIRRKKILEILRGTSSRPSYSLNKAAHDGGCVKTASQITGPS